MVRSSIAKIFKNITWDAGIVIRTAFRGIHKPRKKRPIEYVRFVYKGRYYRRPLSPKEKNPQVPPELLKLPLSGPLVTPRPFQTPPNASAQMADALVASNPSAGRRSTWSWLDWWKLNAPLIIMNLGSLCTLTAFTRTDVLELRSCSVLGNCLFAIYSILQPPPIRWGPPLWSSLFATVNVYKIIQILDERRGNVDLSPREREIYHEHFEPHGVTPKQFEKVFCAGTTRIIKAGGVIQRESELIKSVKLILRGNTRASTLGRHLTAMGSKEGNRVVKPGGDSGSWVGEMAFLTSVDVDRKYAPNSMQSELYATRGSAERSIVKSDLSTSDEKGFRADTTVVAVDDVELIEWSFKDMEMVMKSSRDIHASLTRAMTAAIVGKVVNLIVSQSATPKLSVWLDNWKHSK